MRQSIAPTYESSKTGKPYSVTTRLNGELVGTTPLSDPFMRHRVVIGWIDLLKCLINGKAVIEISLDADRKVVEDVMELDGEYLGQHGSTRRLGWNQHMEGKLSAIAEDPFKDIEWPESICMCHQRPWSENHKDKS